MRHSTSLTSMVVVAERNEHSTKATFSCFHSQCPVEWASQALTQVRQPEKEEKRTSTMKINVENDRAN